MKKSDHGQVYMWQVGTGIVVISRNHAVISIPFCINMKKSDHGQVYMWQVGTGIVVISRNHAVIRIPFCITNSLSP